MRVAGCGYPLDFLDSFAAYAAKLESWVRSGAESADLLVFPEYGGMELATLAGAATARDLRASLRAVSDVLPEADALHARLAERYGVHILAASAPCYDDAASAAPGLPVNRARLFAPGGAVGVQDKQIMTRFEREDWGVAAGGPLRVFDTSLGRIGILICYDSEFPLLGRALRAVDILLVPSCTEAMAGFSRVRIGAMARAMEGQCVAVMSSTVGACDWSEAVDLNTGAGGVFAPPDTGFPPTGVLAQGGLNDPVWTVAEVDLDRLRALRETGTVLHQIHWDEQTGRDVPAPITDLRP